MKEVKQDHRIWQNKLPLRAIVENLSSRKTSDHASRYLIYIIFSFGETLDNVITWKSETGNC